VRVCCAALAAGALAGLRAPRGPQPGQSVPFALNYLSQRQKLRVQVTESCRRHSPRRTYLLLLALYLVALHCM
jgi:hypothetical protein